MLHARMSELRAEVHVADAFESGWDFLGVTLVLSISSLVLLLVREGLDKTRLSLMESFLLYNFYTNSLILIMLLPGLFCSGAEFLPKIERLAEVSGAFYSAVLPGLKEI